MPQTGVFTLDAKQICIVEESQNAKHAQKLISTLSNGQTLTLTGPTSGILPIVQRGCGSFDRTKHPTLHDTDSDPQYGCGFFEAKGLNTALTLKNLWLTNSTSGVIWINEGAMATLDNVVLSFNKGHLINHGGKPTVTSVIIVRGKDCSGKYWPNNCDTRSNLFMSNTVIDSTSYLQNPTGDAPYAIRLWQNNPTYGIGESAYVHIKDGNNRFLGSKLETGVQVRADHGGRIAYEGKCNPGTYRTSETSILFVNDAAAISPTIQGNYYGCPDRCVAGKFASGFHVRLTANDCIECPVGNFCPDGSGEPTPCSSGTHSSSLGSRNQSECSSCPPGKIGKAIANSLTCEDCTEGQFSDDNECKECPAGWWQSQLSQSLCEFCIAGRYSQNVAAATAKNDGATAATNVEHVCVVCPGGRYASGSAMISGKCLACEDGKYIKANEVSNEDEDESAHDDASDCQICLGGEEFVNSSFGCRTCPAGQVSIAQEKGIFSCQTCQSGRFLPDDREDRQRHDEWEDCFKCSSGQFSNSGYQFCYICFSGKYHFKDTSTGSQECKTCNIGQYQNELGQLQCKDCLIGQSATEGSTKCVSCDAGMYSNTVGQACQKCEMGLYRNGGTAATKCTKCEKGRYNELEKQAACKGCEAGKYSSEIGLDAETKCSLCNAGTYSKAVGATSKLSCIDCRQGKIGTEVGSRSEKKCVVCEFGEYRGGTDNATACLKCLPGYKNPTEGSGSCLPCIPGEYQNEKGQSSCKRCVANEKNIEYGSDECVACGIGEKSEEGSAKCTKCDAGEAGTPCQACEAGLYRSGNMDAISCQMCNTGYYQSDKGQTSCLPCIPSEYQNEEGKTACKPCAKNTFSKDKARTQTCAVCSLGRTSAAGSVICSSCSGGQYVDASTDSCLTCPKGYVSKNPNSQTCEQCGTGSKGESSEVGATSCSSCDLGKYQTTPGVCEECKPGQYASDKGLKSCTECPVDTYLSEFGKSSKAECSPCATDRSTGDLIGNTNNSVCLCKRDDYYQNGGKCVVCPVGGDCSAHDGLTLTKVVAMPGYWRANAITDIFTDCKVAFSASLNASADAYARCIGGKSGTTSNFNPDDQCVLGSGGPSCMSCIDGYVMLNSKCTVCNPSILNVVGALAGLMVFLFVIFAVLFMRAKEEKDDDDADDDNTKGDNNTKKTEKGCCGGQKKHKIRKKKNKLTKEQKIENSRDDTAIS